MPVGVYPRYRRPICIIGDGTALIPLTPRGTFAVIDEADIPLVAQYPWSCYRNPRTTSPYALANRANRNDYNAGTIFMHRLIMAAPKGVQVDHINGDGLDNRRANLRLCAERENAFNRRKHQPGSSRFKGVTKRSGYDRWRARIRVRGDLVALGDYATEDAAARAYDEAAVRLHGRFARLNFPESRETDSRANHPTSAR